MTSDHINKLRYRCQTDLYFLAKSVLGKDLEEQPHRKMCDLFVKKDPDKKYTQWSTYKNRLLMVPRGSFKSTIDVVDCVQAIICNPDIRILIITAALDLAEAFVAELRHYFLIDENDGPTQFQTLFPEFCLPSKTKSLGTEFTTPARKTWRKEPTVWAGSSGINLPGWHCDFLKLDDCVNNLNTNEDLQIAKTITTFNFARKLVDPGGYIDIIGTPYNPNDLYAFVQKNIDSDNLLVYAEPAWRIIKKRRKGEEQIESDYELFFPTRLTYQFLKQEQKVDPITFESQYLINPRAKSGQLFDEDIVRGSVINWKAIPQNLVYYATWDLSYKQGMGTNSTCGPVVGIDQQGRIYLLNITWGKYAVGDLSFHIADTMRRYNLQLTGIEDVNGGQWLVPEIERQCVRLGVVPRIYWIPVDRNKDAKFNRIMLLTTLFEQKRLFISDACPMVDQIIDQILDYTGSKNGQDDILDALSFIPKFVKIYPQEDPDTEKYKTEWEKMQRNSLQSMLYPSQAIIPNTPESEPEVAYNEYF